MLERKVEVSEVDEELDRLRRSGQYTVIDVASIKGDKTHVVIHYKPRLNPKPRATHALRGVAGVSGKAEMSRSRKIVRRLFDLATAPSKEPARRIAERFLARCAPQLGIARTLDDLKFERVKESVLGRHVLFQQYVGKTQIAGAWVRVDIDAQGRVFNLQNDLVPLAVMTPRRKGATMTSRLAGDEGRPITEEDARARARAAVEVKPGGYRRQVGKPELLYRPTEGEPRLTWKFVIRSGPPTREWKMYLDAFTGEVLWRRNLLKRAPTRKGGSRKTAARKTAVRRAVAQVFDPNPVVALNTTRLTDSARIPAAAYREVELRGLTGSGYLDGQYVSTRLTRKRVRRTGGDFRFRRGERGFTEAMVYFHIDRMQRHLQSLGFRNILDQGIAVNVAGQREDNSYYSPTEKMLSFGTGGVNDAEDAETILHEYGHAIQDHQVPGFGESDECGAMGEGFGDFLAASFFADWKPAWLRPAIASWDCIDFAGEPPCLRRLDSNKKYPKDITGEVHDDGEIWSACLWELRHQLGRGTAERLIIAHHYLLNRWAGFEDAAQAMLTTDQQLFDGRHQNTIREVFVRRGVLPDRRQGNRRAGDRFAG